MFGNGKVLCWESIVEHAMGDSSFGRAYLMTSKAWSIHPRERSEKFKRLIPQIINKVNLGEYPEGQAGHFDLILDCWENFIDDKF